MLGHHVSLPCAAMHAAAYGQRISRLCKQSESRWPSRLREAGAIILAKANMGEYATGNPRSSFGGVFVNAYVSGTAGWTLPGAAMSMRLHDARCTAHMCS